MASWAALVQRTWLSDTKSLLSRRLSSRAVAASTHLCCRRLRRCHPFQRRLQRLRSRLPLRPRALCLLQMCTKICRRPLVSLDEASGVATWVAASEEVLHPFTRLSFLTCQVSSPASQSAVRVRHSRKISTRCSMGSRNRRGRWSCLCPRPHSTRSPT